jgi:alpha-beta hydrolase superfamily lysophospholipase
MIFPLAAALLLTLATLLLALLIALFWRRRVSSWGRFWRGALWLHSGLFVVHLFVTFPLLLGLLGSRGLGTRPQELGYAGPRLDANGQMLVQSWASLEAEKVAGRPSVDASIVAAAHARERHIPSTDGVTLRAFRLEAKQEPPVATVVLVHGLFRSGMELEPVSSMWHELGCECWLLELRNHGGSTRAPFTAGWHESQDVVKAVEYVRAQPGRERTPMILWGVSLGTLAVGMALPHIDRLAGVVLDAPMDDLTAAAHRMLSFDRGNDRRSWLHLSEPWRSLVILSLEQWSGFRARDVSPGEVLANLPQDLPVLMVGEGIDDRAPPETVERLFARLPMPADQKQLWMVMQAKHGQAFAAEGAAYAEHLAWLLAHLRRG